MKLKLALLAGAGLVATLISPACLKSQTITPIPVVNNLWTSNSAADGSFVVTTVGWTLTGSDAISVSLNETSSPYVGQTGNQLGQIFTFGSYTGYLYQVLPDNFVPGDTYTLTADVDNDADMSGWELAIIGGSSMTLASTPITNTPPHTLVPFSVSWTDPLSGGSSLSSPIEIALDSTSGTPLYEGIEIDNVGLTQETAVPEPSTWSLLGVAVFCGLLVRKRVAVYLGNSR